MDKKDQNSYFLLMMDAFGKIREYIAGMSYDDFVKDSKTQSAIIMQLQVIGELGKQSPEKIKNQIEIPWKDIIGMRDIISHHYFGVDIKVVWDTVVNSVPEAEQKIGEYLKNIQK